MGSHLHIGALWCIGISLGIIALTLMTTCYHTYYTVSPVLESYHHGHLGQSITELRETMHRAHDITERVQPEHFMELWNMTNAILRRVPWEQLTNVSAQIRDAAVNVKTKELVETVDRVIQDVRKLPIEHVLNVVDMFTTRQRV